MEIFLRILKETAIAIIALALVALVVWLLFQEQLPFLGKPVPDSIEYAGINLKEFNIEGNLENEYNPTQIYEVTQEHLKGYETEGYVSTGAINPFTAQSSEPDVPTERVTIENSANGGNSSSGGNSTIQNGDEATGGNENTEEVVEDDSGTKSLE